LRRGYQISGAIFSQSGIKDDIEKLKKDSQQSDIWNDPKKAQKIMQELNAKKNLFDQSNSIFSMYEDLQALCELYKESPEKSLVEEGNNTLEALENSLDDLEIKLLLSDEYDQANAYFSIHPGAGGTESQDWAQMLYRMYTRWFEQNNYSYEVIDYLPGEVAGIKNVTMLVKGEFAFGYLKCERGVHRLVRISPFDSNARRHTSFCSVDVFPEVSDDIEIDIKPEDLRIDTYRSSGAGGQHVNKTDSAIRITHLPTGIVVQCQNERSQISNKNTAMKMLTAKLYEHYRLEKEAEMAKMKGEKKEIGWGSQIRSYVFQPYTLVKDHRTNFEIGNIQKVMDGDISGFIKEFLLFLRK